MPCAHLWRRHHWCGAEGDNGKCKAVERHMAKIMPDKHDAVAIVPANNHNADPAQYMFAFRARHGFPPVADGLIGREIFKTDGHLVPDGAGELEVPDRRIKRKADEPPPGAPAVRGRGRGRGARGGRGGRGRGRGGRAAANS